MSCPSPRAAVAPSFPLGIRGLLKESLRLFWAFYLWVLLWAFAFGFDLGFSGLGFGFGLFGVGSFWKGKKLLKEKELLKGNCWREKNG
jgi:hypothetical protein